MLKLRRLPNGLLFVFDHRPHAVDFSFGLAFRAGKRDERPEEHGRGHGLEHITGRGSKLYPTTYDLARPLDRLSGATNASTGDETTMYYTNVPAEHWRTAVELTTDMVYHALFRPRDVGLEKETILEEYFGDQDDPGQMLINSIQDLVYGDCTLGRPIIGTEKSIRSFTSANLRAFRDQHYLAGDTAVVAVGKLSRGLGKELERRFGRLPARTSPHDQDGLGEALVRNRAIYRRDLEQVHFSLGFRNGYGHGHPLNAAADVLCTALSAYASATLPMELREKRGLVYNIDVGASNYRGTGDIMVTGSLVPEKLERGLPVIVKELKRIKRHGLSTVDLADAKSNLGYGIVLGAQSSPDEMRRLAEAALHDPIGLDIASIRREIRRVTNAEIIKVANEVFTARAARFATVGPVREHRPYLAMLDRLDGS